MEYKAFNCPISVDTEHEHDKQKDKCPCIYCGIPAECPGAPGDSGTHENLFGYCRFCGTELN